MSVSFTTGTDGGSGIGTRLLQRASAPLTGTTCGTYGAFATVTNGTNPTSPVVDTVNAGTCSMYQYVVSDNVGNQHTATSANVVKVSVVLRHGLRHRWPAQLLASRRGRRDARPTPTPAPRGRCSARPAGRRGRRHLGLQDRLGQHRGSVTPTAAPAATAPATPSTTPPRPRPAPTTRSKPICSSSRTSPATGSASSAGWTRPDHRCGLLHGEVGTRRQPGTLKVVNGTGVPARHVAQALVVGDDLSTRAGP